MPEGKNNLPTLRVLNPHTPVPFLKRVDIAIKTAGNIIGNITPETWMSALQPLIPFAPVVSNRQFDYPVGYNINYTTQGRDAGRPSFASLRNMAVQCETLRIVIETRKDQLCSQPWKITPKDEDQADVENSRIEELTAFFKKPDRVHDWESWLRSILEELFVTDTVSLYRRPTRGGGLYSLDQIDGSTIFALIDANGRRPGPGEPAYQQILKGVPKVNYTTEELLYLPRNVRVYSPYGYSPAEQVIITAQTEIQRCRSQLQYFTAGSTPDTYAVVGDDIPADMIEAFEAKFNSLLSGNTPEKWQVPFLPKDTELKQTKQPVLKDEFDEWIAKKVCAAFSIPATMFMKQMNKGEVDNAQNQALAEGLVPLKKWVKHIVDTIIEDNFGVADLEFSWVDTKDPDLKEAMEVDTGYVEAGILTINEIRDKLGQPPVEGGERPMVKTGTGYAPLDAFEQQQAAAAALLAATPDDPNDPNAPPGQDEDEDKGGGEGNPPPKAKAEKAAGKAGGQKPLPFPRSNTTRAARRLAGQITPILAATGRSVAAQIRAGTLQKVKNLSKGQYIPDSLYVRRPVMNAEDISAWARDNGFTSTLIPADMHITVAFSRQPVEGAAPLPDRLVLPAGSAQALKPLGPNGAVVMPVVAPELVTRWQALRDLGASWDWPSYHPHVTITYNGKDVDLAAIALYPGEIILGPEIHEGVKENWQDGIVEKAALRKDQADDIVAALSLADLDALINATPAQMEKVLQETGQHVMAQLGTEHRRDLVNQVNERAVKEARARAAEMVGKKWVDGELVDNPKAEWRIDEATRDEIRGIIADGLEDNIGADAIADLIEDAGAFSPERAQLIADTEIARANSLGSQNAMQEAVNAGVRVKKAWFPDPQACEICKANADQGPIDLDDVFESGDDVPPAHPNCECALQPVVDDDD